MTAVLIVLITIAVVFLIVSGLIMKDEDKEITEISDAKKQSIDKLVDDYFNKSISGKAKTLKPMVEKEIANKIKSNNEMLEKENKKTFEKFNPLPLYQ